MTRRLRLLLLSYYYPPAGGPAVQRAENLLRYLPPDVDATVITAAVEDYEALSPLRMPLDPGRFRVEAGVLRVPAGCPYKLFQVLPKLRLAGAIRWCYVPDVARNWARRACRVAADLHQRSPFDVVFSTAPPFSVALAGRDCARQLRIPWVCDLRDLWSGYLLGAWPSRWHYNKEVSLERSALAEAAITVMVTPGSRDWMLRRYPFLEPDGVEYITNGYNPSDFPAESTVAEDKFVIVHAGVFCGPQPPESGLRRLTQGRSFQVRRVDRSTHSPAMLLRAMELLGDRRVEFRHLGPIDSENQRLFETSPVRNQVRMLGYRDHREALAELMRADAAYLCLATCEESRSELIPQKTFEYLGSRKPVLAPIQNGDARDCLLEAGTGICTPPYDAEALARALKDLVAAKFSHQPLAFPREDFIRRFEWSRLADKLFCIIERAASMQAFGLSKATPEVHAT